MKNQTTRKPYATTKGFIITIAAIIALFTSPLMVSAGDTTTFVTNKADIQYYETPGKHDALFSINYELENNELLQFTMTDADGFVFYDQEFSTNKLSKKFLFKDIGFKPLKLILIFKTRTGTEVQEMVIGE